MKKALVLGLMVLTLLLAAPWLTHAMGNPCGCFHEDTQVTAPPSDDPVDAPADTSDNVPGGDLHLSRLSITSTPDTTSTIAPGDTVIFTANVSDPIWAGPAKNVVAYEGFFNSSGTIIATSAWPIGTMHPGESHSFTYHVVFSSHSPTGWYFDKIELTGSDVSGGLQPNPGLSAQTALYVFNPADAVVDDTPVSTPTSTPPAPILNDSQITLTPPPIILPPFSLPNPVCLSTDNPKKYSPDLPINFLADIGGIFHNVLW